MAISDFLQENPDKTAKDITIACYGLAFKSDIDDLRESPALEITKAISDMHAGRVLAVEPNIDNFEYKDIKLCSLIEAEQLSDIGVLLVDHREFKEVKLPTDYLIDTKGIWK